MKCHSILVLLVIFCEVLVPFSVNADDEPTETTKLEGEVKRALSTLFITSASVEDRAKNTADPCNYKLLEKPDFSAPGRKISEEKCYDYLWDIKFREHKAEKEDACRESKFFGPGVIGGRDAIPGEFPHMGAVGWKTPDDNWVFKCGSTLISPKFVITAGHCTRASDRDSSIADPVPKIVRMGVVLLHGKRTFQRPSDYTISRIIVHPKYAPPKKYYDLALMELETNVPFSINIQPACLWSNFDTSRLGSTAVVAGWGVVDAGNPLSSSPELQTAEIDIIDSKTCDELLRPMCNRLWCGVNDTQICAGKLVGGVDTCGGDSGGPLQVKIPLPPTTQGTMYYLLGVTSFGFRCALQNTPGVYTRVSSFVDWIESVVWK